MLRKEENDWVKKCMEYVVEGARPKGRPKKTWDTHTHTHTHTHNNHFTALWTLPGTTQVSRYPLTPVMVISHPLSASCTYYDSCHPPCSIYLPDSLFHNLTPSF